MTGPIGLCDAPGCGLELVALIRGVGLCEAHLERVAACAAVQETDPGSLSRPVILALIQPDRAATSEARLNAPVRRTPQAETRPGFYWVHEEGGWTIIQVTRAGAYLRLGVGEELPLQEHKFARMLPARQPHGFPWDPFAQR